MLMFKCPSCMAKCTVGDEFRGRKVRCPKCRTRVRYHKDGAIELLSVGSGSPMAVKTADSPQAGAAPKADASPSAPPVGDRPVSPAPDKPPISTTSEGRWKTRDIVILVAAVLIIGALVTVGVVQDNLVLVLAPVPLALVAALVVMHFRKERGKEPAPSPAPVPPSEPSESEKTDRLDLKLESDPSPLPSPDKPSDNPPEDKKVDEGEIKTDWMPVP